VGVGEKKQPQHRSADQVNSTAVKAIGKAGGSVGKDLNRAGRGVTPKRWTVALARPGGVEVGRVGAE